MRTNTIGLLLLLATRSASGTDSTQTCADVVNGHVTIPEGITKIADQAFNGCTALTSISLPTSLTEIGIRCFKACTALTTIVIPSSVTAIGLDAFQSSGISCLPVSATVTIASTCCGNPGVCPSPPPGPPSQPPAEPGAVSGIAGDPHLSGAHGEEADFKGVDGGVYNVLSARNMSLNVMVQHDVFNTPHSKLTVHGSFIRAVYQTLRTRQTARLLQIFFHAKDPHRVLVGQDCTPPFCRERAGTLHIVTDGGAPYVFENVRVSLRSKALEVANGQWHTRVVSTVGAPHWGKLRINLQMKPTYGLQYDPVAPHGIIGQTYDGDKFEVNGHVDTYSRLDDGRLSASRTAAGGHVTTRAQAEGAIESTLEDYHMASDFATGFRFSRFDAVAAGPRNVSEMTGLIGPKHRNVNAGRERG